jgi:hypothetical protein
LGSLDQVVETQVDGMIRGLGRRTDDLLRKFNRPLPYGPQLSAGIWTVRYPS